MISPTRSPLPRRRASSPSTTPRPPGTRRTLRAVRVRRLRRRPFPRRPPLRRLFRRRLPPRLRRLFPLLGIPLRRAPVLRVPVLGILVLGTLVLGILARWIPVRLLRLPSLLRRRPRCRPSPLRRLRHCPWVRLRRAFRVRCRSCPWGVGSSLLSTRMTLPTRRGARRKRTPGCLRSRMRARVRVRVRVQTRVRVALVRLALPVLPPLPSCLPSCRRWLPVVGPPTGAGPWPGLRLPCM